MTSYSFRHFHHNTPLRMIGRMIAPPVRMMLPYSYTRQKLRKRHFLMTDNTDLLKRAPHAPK
jgi:hypothetical protein